MDCLDPHDEQGNHVGWTRAVQGTRYRVPVGVPVLLPVHCTGAKFRSESRSAECADSVA